MAHSRINKETLGFLNQLTRNNNRDWFNSHKELYLEAQKNVESFVDSLIGHMNKHDDIETPTARKSLYRIYNDVRFSRDKSPYNPRFSGYLRRRKPLLRGGYYFWIKPGASHVACGFAYPNSDDLRRIRQDIDLNHEDWIKLLRIRSIKNTFGDMQGEKVKTSPQGFSREHPAIELLRFKQFWFEHSFTDQEVLSPDFLVKINKTFKAIRPFFDYMSDILNTDANGEAINR